MELFHRMAESAQKFDYRNDKQPLVSLYIISYNNVHLLYHAIKSVLAQTHGNIEITISDDASVGCTIEDSARLVCLAALDRSSNRMKYQRIQFFVTHGDKLKRSLRTSAQLIRKLYLTGRNLPTGLTKHRPLS